ncbi:MAG TPA: hypothetical protein PKD94_04590 [Ignavibacteria bacterium]|nr:hypothetical protein [Ignavibacteria bacterium]
MRPFAALREKKMENNYILMLSLPLVILAAFVVIRMFSKKGGRTMKGKEKNFAGKFERKRYSFHNGLRCWQEQLSTAQTEELAELLHEIEIEPGTELTLESVSGALFRKKGLRKLEMIILRAADESAPIRDAQLMELKQDEVEVILNDFFTLNPKMRLAFEILKIAVASTGKTEAKNTDTDLKKEH